MIVDAQSYREELPKIREAVRGGAEFKCYVAADYAKIAHMAVDYRWLFGYAGQLENVIKLKDLELSKAAEQVAIYNVTIAESKKSIQYISDIFDKEHSARIEREKQNRLIDILKTTAIGVEALVIVGLATALIIDRSQSAILVSR